LDEKMSTDRARLEFRWSRPNNLTEIGGTSEGLTRLASAASRAAADGKTEVSDDDGTMVHILRDEDLQPSLKKARTAASAIFGATIIFLYRRLRVGDRGSVCHMETVVFIVKAARPDAPGSTAPCDRGSS
jgi:hypothetical protein